MIEQRGFVRFFVGKKYGSKGYAQRNAAHMGSIYIHLQRRPPEDEQGNARNM
jgi:hypothetical protein